MCVCVALFCYSVTLFVSRRTYLNTKDSFCGPNLINTEEFGTTEKKKRKEKGDISLSLSLSLLGDETFACAAAQNERNETTTANDDDVVMAPEGSVVLDVLANDVDVEGYGLSLATFDATSSLGGTIVQEGNALRYTAPSNTGVDSFAYQVQSIFGLIAEGTVVIELTDALPGVQVEYFDLDALSELPDFGPLVPISAEVLTQVNLPSTGGEPECQVARPNMKNYAIPQ